MRLLHIISDTDMRARHAGLREQLKKAKGVDFSKLKPGDIIAFLNTKRDRLMVLNVLDEEDSYGLLHYYRSPHGRVPPEALEWIPESLGGGHLDMNKATRLGLVKLLSKKGSDYDEEN